MDILMKTVEKPIRGTASKTAIKMHPIKGFMDVMTVACKTVVEAC